jgi:hypothetical protein
VGIGLRFARTVPARIRASFGTPTHVDELATSSQDFPSWISPDGCRMYFWSGGAAGDLDIWQATRPK